MTDLRKAIEELFEEVLDFDTYKTYSKPLKDAILAILSQERAATIAECIGCLPEKREPKNLHLTYDNGGFMGNYCDTCKIFTFDKDTFEETGAWCLCYPFNAAITTAKANMKELK